LFQCSDKHFGNLSILVIGAALMFAPRDRRGYVFMEKTVRLIVLIGDIAVPILVVYMLFVKSAN